MRSKHSSFVLKAFWILGPEEILKLAHGLKQEEIGLKRASGDDIAFWKEEKPMPQKKAAETKSEAKVLAFNRSIPKPEESKEEAESGSQDGQILSSEVVLLQREIARDSAAGTQKSSAKAGYQKSTEMYVVKSSTSDGKEKIRFASTNGILVNKKQA